MHLGPAWSECLSLSAEPCAQDCPACPSQVSAFEIMRELLELKPVVRALWTIVPGRVLTKLYQESSEVYSGNLGCHFSSPDTPYGEKVQKAANLRNKLSPVSARTCFGRAEGKKG